MRRMKNVLFGLMVSLFLFSVVVNAANENKRPDATTIYVANQVMERIFEAVMSLKEEYVDLQGFDDKALFRNESGIYVIHYKNVQEYAAGQVLSEFGLTVLPMDVPNIFGKHSDVFEYGFPLSQVKFSGYQILNERRRPFDIKVLLNKFGVELKEDQNRFLPFQLSIQPSKAVYFPNEDIKYTVYLTNATRGILNVKQLSHKTLHCTSKGKSWGSKKLSSRNNKHYRQKFLKPGQSDSLTLSVSGTPRAEIFDIQCEYLMSHKGFKPFAVAQIQVTP